MCNLDIACNVLMCFSLFEDELGDCFCLNWYKLTAGGFFRLCFEQMLCEPLVLVFMPVSSLSADWFAMSGVPSTDLSNLLDDFRFFERYLTRSLRARQMRAMANATKSACMIHGAVGATRLVFLDSRSRVSYRTRSSANFELSDIVMVISI